MIPTSTDTAQVTLASSSPRRAQLLDQLCISYSVCPADIDESSLQQESPEAYVERLARCKAIHVRKHASPSQNVNVENHPVLAADTCVALQGRIYGKPQDRDDAVEFLLELSDRTHSVYTGTAIVSGASCVSCTAKTDVTFRAISEDEAARYWATREPEGKAGGYAIQGMGAVFVQHLDGSYSNVMGLPLLETTRLLKLSGIHIF